MRFVSSMRKLTATKFSGCLNARCYLRILLSRFYKYIAKVDSLYENIFSLKGRRHQLVN